MEEVAKLIPLLWSFIEKHKKCAVGISPIGDEIIVTLLWNKVRWKKFASRDVDLLHREVVNFLQAV